VVSRRVKLKPFWGCLDFGPKGEFPIIGRRKIPLGQEGWIGDFPILREGNL